MPRRRRQEEEGRISHISARGVNGEFVFKDDEDRAGYLMMLAATVTLYGWLCLSYCLMGTHLHLLIETPHANLGAGMQWLHGRYAGSFNKQYRRRGHLFQDRYHAEPVMSEAHLISAIGYIAANPVDAGLCLDPSDWLWGSHARVTAGTVAPWMAHERLLDHLDGITGSRAYDRLVATRLRPY